MRSDDWIHHRQLRVAAHSVLLSDGGAGKRAGGMDTLARAGAAGARVEKSIHWFLEYTGSGCHVSLIWKPPARPHHAFNTLLTRFCRQKQQIAAVPPLSTMHHHHAAAVSKQPGHADGAIQTRAAASVHLHVHVLSEDATIILRTQRRRQRHTQACRGTWVSHAVATC